MQEHKFAVHNFNVKREIYTISVDIKVTKRGQIYQGCCDSGGHSVPNCILIRVPLVDLKDDLIGKIKQEKP